MASAGGGNKNVEIHFFFKNYALRMLFDPFLILVLHILFVFSTTIVSF